MEQNGSSMEACSQENDKTEQIKNPICQLKVADVFSCLANDNLCPTDKELIPDEDSTTLVSHSDEQLSLNAIQCNEHSPLVNHSDEQLSLETIQSNEHFTLSHSEEHLSLEAIQPSAPISTYVQSKVTVSKQLFDETLINDKHSHVESSNAYENLQKSNNDEKSLMEIFNSDDKSCGQAILTEKNSNETFSSMSSPINNKDVADKIHTGNKISQSHINESDSFMSDEPSLTNMSESLSNLLSVVEKENCSELEQEIEKDTSIKDEDGSNNDNDVSKNDNESCNLNTLVLPASNEDEMTTETSISNNNKSRKRLNSNLSSNGSPPKKKKDEFGRYETSNVKYLSDQGVKKKPNVASEIPINKIFKEEKKDATENLFVEPSWKNVQIKTEGVETDNEMADDSEQHSLDMNQSNGNIKIKIEPLPEYLRSFARIRPSVIVSRVRTLPNGEKIKVKAVKVARLANAWAFKETFLSFFDRSLNLRQRLDLGGTPYMYTKSIISDLHPVDIGSKFPFSCPDNGSKKSSRLLAQIAPPLAQLVLKHPDIASGRKTTIEGKLKKIATVKFSKEMLDCAFKESLLSQFQSSPDATYMLNVDNTWPDCSFEALDAIEIDCKFPFAFSDVLKEKSFFDPLDISLPSCFFKKGVSLPAVSQQLKKRYYMARDYLLRLMGTASFYIYNSILADLEAKPESKLFYDSIVCSLRPLVISQANDMANAIVDIREKTLSPFVCEDPNVILSLINGPISLSSYFFGNVKNLEKTMKNHRFTLNLKES